MSVLISSTQAGYRDDTSGQHWYATIYYYHQSLIVSSFLSSGLRSYLTLFLTLLLLFLTVLPSLCNYCCNRCIADAFSLQLLSYYCFIVASPPLLCHSTLFCCLFHSSLQFIVALIFSFLHYFVASCFFTVVLLLPLLLCHLFCSCEVLLHLAILSSVVVFSSTVAIPFYYCCGISSTLQSYSFSLLLCCSPFYYCSLFLRLLFSIFAVLPYYYGLLNCSSLLLSYSFRLSLRFASIFALFVFSFSFLLLRCWLLLFSHRSLTVRLVVALLFTSTAILFHRSCTSLLFACFPNIALLCFPAFHSALLSFSAFHSALLSFSAFHSALLSFSAASHTCRLIRREYKIP